MVRAKAAIMDPPALHCRQRRPQSAPTYEYLTCPFSCSATVRTSSFAAKEFLEAGKRRLAGDTARSATTSEVKDLKRQALELKEVVAEQALELRLLKKSMTGDGGDEA